MRVYLTRDNKKKKTTRSIINDPYNTHTRIFQHSYGKKTHGLIRYDY